MTNNERTDRRALPATTDIYNLKYYNYESKK